MMDQPQLKMVRPLESVPPVRLAEGYTLGIMQTGQEDAWAKVLSSVGDLGEWNAERALGSFSGTDRVWREAVHLVWSGGTPVGTTCVQLHGGWADNPELGWVAVDPGHQGKGLGTALCAAVLGFLKDKGYAKCYLTTDDHRLPAIKSYLNLGFIPSLEHGSHESRWREVLGRMGLTLEDYVGGEGS